MRAGSSQPDQEDGMAEDANDFAPIAADLEKPHA
jgi:hypothetical protein